MKTLTLLLGCFMMANISLAQTNKKVIKAYFIDQKVKATLICDPIPISPEEAAAQDIMNINEALMGAEKETRLLDINLLLSKQAIQNNTFVFGIESEEALNLSLAMYDEEGFSMVVDCDFELKAGGSFLAINIENLENGTYLLRIKDNEGAEIIDYIEVSKK